MRDLNAATAHHRWRLAIGASILAVAGCAGGGSHGTPSGGDRQAAVAPAPPSPAALKISATERCAEHLQMGLSLTSAASSTISQERAFSRGVGAMQPETDLFAAQLRGYLRVVKAKGHPAAMHDPRFQVPHFRQVCQQAGT